MKKLSIALLTLIVFLSACVPLSTEEHQPTVVPGIENDQDDIDFLQEEYNKFSQVFTKLNSSPGEGEDVRNAYFASQAIIEEISERDVSAHLEPLKKDLIEGIGQQSTGFGCYSNKKLCSGDVEATKLLLQGRILLDEFLREVQKIQ